jgi:hypothetical protein
MKRTTILTISAAVVLIGLIAAGFWYVAVAKTKQVPASVIVIQPPENTTAPTCKAFMQYLADLTREVKTDTLNHYDYSTLQEAAAKISQQHAEAIKACPKE